jgi:hypothetical protein
VLEFPLPASCSFSLHFLPPCNIFLHLWLFFAIGSIHQEAQAIKFNCSCTSGLLRLQLSSTKFQVQLLAVLQDFSGFNCLLPTFKFNCNCTSSLLRLQLSSTFFSSTVFFRSIYLVINIYLLSLSNSLSIKNLAKFLILKIAILSSKSSKLIATSTFLASISRLFSKLPSLINNFRANFFNIRVQI